MKKKNLGLAIILPMIFGSLGLLYSSVTAGVIMIVINIVLGIVLAISNSLDSIMFFSLVLQPLVILWSVLVAKRKNDSIEKNETISNDLEINLGGEAFMQALIVIFFTLGITAIVSQFNETNILSTNLYVFYLLEIILTVVISVLPERKVRKETVTKQELTETEIENNAT